MSNTKDSSRDYQSAELLDAFVFYRWFLLRLGRTGGERDVWWGTEETLFEQFEAVNKIIPFIEKMDRYCKEQNRHFENGNDE